MSKGISVVMILSLIVFGFTSEPSAQKYPDRPITLVLPMAPGDGIDVAGRAMGEELAKLLKVSVVPLNKAGRGSHGWDGLCREVEKGRLHPSFYQ